MVQFGRGCLIISVSKIIDLRLTLSYYNHIVDLPMSSVSARDTGEYLSRFSDASTIRTAISNATVTLFFDTVMVLGCGVILFITGRQMFFVSLAMIAVYVAIVIIYKRPVERSNRSVMESNAVVQSYLKESIDGIETVKAAGADKQVKDRTTAKFNRFLKAVVKNSMISVSQDTLAIAVELIGTVFILWMGFSMVQAGTVAIGTLIAFYVLLGYFTEPVKNLIELQPTIQTAFVAADRLNDILELRKEDVSDTGERLPTVESWEIKDVDFRYGNRELTLSKVSMQIRRGEKIAIVGESGSGKTTLAKLLLRFYEPEGGLLSVDGRDMGEIPLSALRGAIAYVDQNTFMFSDTIKNNLRLGDPSASDDEIKAACKACGADEFIEALPLKYDMPLEENGMDLSGGQRQRLAIARALLKKPQLLVLDEATSNLDTITEAGIKNTLFRFDEALTCVIIAHRLTTVKNCDRVYVMEKGSIVESGTHEELMGKNGKYAELWNMQ